MSRRKIFHAPGKISAIKPTPLNQKNGEKKKDLPAYLITTNKKGELRLIPLTHLQDINNPDQITTYIYN